MLILWTKNHCAHGLFLRVPPSLGLDSESRERRVTPHYTFLNLDIYIYNVYNILPNFVFFCAWGRKICSN